MTADSARPLRTRRCIYGGLLAAAGVAVAVALIFTAGGAGQKKDKAAVTSGDRLPLGHRRGHQGRPQRHEAGGGGARRHHTTPAATTTSPGRHQPRADVHSD